MAIYDINYNNKSVEWLPPDKRNLNNVKWVQTLLSQVQYLRDKVLGDYRTGSSYSQWVAGTYTEGARVIYKQVVYESLIDGNTDTPNSINWMVYLPSFIGVDKRVKFNGIYLTLTYALNQYYQTTFRQPLLLGYSLSPDSEHALYSDIFITNGTFEVVGFVVGETEPYSSEIGQTYSSDDIGYSYPFETLINFTINIPVAVYATTNEAEVRNFVNRIIPAGINYNITTY
jgi:hypothetical protein